MNSKQFDKPSSEDARKIIEFLTSEVNDNLLYIDTGGNAQREVIYLANTIVGSKPVCLLDIVQLMEKYPGIVPRLKKIAAINPNISIEFINTLNLESNKLAVGSSDAISKMKKVFEFGRNIKTSFGTLPDEHPATNIYHILLGRVLGYSDSEISDFIKTDAQTAFARFKEWVREEDHGYLLNGI